MPYRTAGENPRPQRRIEDEGAGPPQPSESYWRAMQRQEQQRRAREAKRVDAVEAKDEPYKTKADALAALQRRPDAATITRLAWTDWSALPDGAALGFVDDADYKPAPQPKKRGRKEGTTDE